MNNEIKTRKFIAIHRIKWLQNAFNLISRKLLIG